ncbi:MAG TPA: DUF3891 family protein [Acidobacteriaceae bacterium]
MIVQSAATGQPHFVIQSTSHARMAHQLSSHFGNKEFSSLNPLALMNYVVRNHEAGWDSLDEDPQWNPDTGLPYHLSAIPELLHLQKGRLSPVFNEKHHPFCGLLSSMHEWGLYNRRYGLSEVALISEISKENFDAVSTFLEEQLEYQEHLKRQLSACSETKSLVAPAALFNSYKLLEFFDTLALYFNRVHEEAWDTDTYNNVPINLESDTTVTIRPIRPHTVSLEPWPFCVRAFDISCEGRYLYPVRGGSEVRDVFRTTGVQTQTFTVAIE